MNTVNTSTFASSDADSKKHTLVIAEKITITGILNVDSMREECVTIKLRDGVCTICGKGLFAEKLDTVAGEVVLVGKAESIKYSNQGVAKKAVFKNLFK